MTEYITGASGFIGTKLSKRIKAIPIPHNDIPTFKFKSFDRLFYLSSYGNLSTQVDIPETIQANLTDPVDVAVRTSLIDYKSFVFFSSSSVLLPRQTMYSRCKKATEQVLLSFMETLKKPMCIVRPYSVTGVGEQSKHLIPTIIRSCLTGAPMNLAPNPTHDFIDVEDVVDGVLNLSGNSARGIFELGNGKKHTNLEVLRLVEDITGKKANVTMVNSMRSYDNDSWVCNNFRARGWGWLPKITLRQSITNMVTKYKETHDKK